MQQKRDTTLCKRVSGEGLPGGKTVKVYDRRESTEGMYGGGSRLRRHVFKLCGKR